MQNGIDHPSTGRQARCILRKVRALLSNHDLRRSNYYAKSFGGEVGVCFCTVAKILNMEYSPPGRTATHPTSMSSSGSEAAATSVDWFWADQHQPAPPSLATRDSYLIRLGESSELTSENRLALLREGVVQYGTGKFVTVHVQLGDITLRGPLPPVVIASKIATIEVGSLVLQINRRSVMDFERTSCLLVASVTVGV